MTDTFVIRRLGKKDIALVRAVAEIFLGRRPVRPQHFTRMLSDQRNIVIAALAQKRPIGFLVAHQFPSLAGERLVYLYDIEVQPAYRRLGVARSMLSRLKDLCRANAIDRIWVGSSLSNTGACSLWEATGAIRESDQYAEYIYRLDAQPGAPADAQPLRGWVPSAAARPRRG